MKTLMILILATSFVCQAQTAPTIKGHTLGESIQQFTSESNEVTRGQMQSCLASDGNGSHQRTFTRCSEFLSTLKTGSGNFACEDMIYENPQFDEQVCHNFRGRVTFAHNKLVELNLEIIDKEWSDALTDVTTKFGKPDETHIDTEQNGYGAKFDLQRASWAAPDYIVVLLEKINVPYNLKRFVEVNLTDREYFKSELAKKPHGNALD